MNLQKTDWDSGAGRMQGLACFWGNLYTYKKIPSPDKGIHAFSAGILAFSVQSALDVPAGTPADGCLETASNYALKKPQSSKTDVFSRIYPCQAKGKI